MSDRYKAYAYKLNKNTAESLKKQKIKSGKSWNLFFVDLLKILNHYKKQ